MLRSRLTYLLEKYQAKKLTKEESAELDAWYELELKTDVDFFEDMSQQDIKAYSKSLFLAIREKIEQEEAGKSNSRFKIRWQWAAAAMLIVAAGSIIYQFGAISSRLPENLATTLQQTTPAPNPYQTDTNHTAKPMIVRLADCSLVELLPGASIRYDRGFGHTNRVLALNGAGYFDVQKGLSYPFTVHTGPISTTALGTSFIIDTRATGKTIIKLLTGKVSVQFETAPALFMLPGDSLVMNKNSGQVVQLTKQPAAKSANKKISVANNLLGKTGFRHEFHQTSLSSVLDILKTGYQVNISYDAASLNDLYFSGSIQEQDSLSTILKRLELLHDLQIRITQTGLVIQKN